MNYTSESAITLQDNRIAASVILTVCLFGFFCNLSVILLMRTAPSLANSFGVLAFSQAIADCGHQAIFAFYVVPLLLFEFKFFKEPALMRRIGHNIVIFYQVCGYSHVCTSFNRFSPTWFTKVFS
ncbi:hypothetical protein PENTCL1PPCAC_28875 [Pristionchus entomophagus]|uniref:7TM GPCR serpentine receptor class x (Srx) domain-containing protein n=1 Tax=Pristionchus entomophagus TaxID=358040 RepID=A0AAV5UI03_9BILA|nr:hypothetical protein PENTCL1PPCAC_28875 [Pristionchus entomophagus]